MLRDIRLPYFGRVSVTLSEVAVILTITLLASEWFSANALSRVAYFPVFALCLIADGFAKTLAKEGRRSAIWRLTMTALVAVLITLVAQNHTARQAVLRYPELLFVQIGCIVVIAKFLDFRLLSRLNPPAAATTPCASAENVLADGIEVKQGPGNSEKADDRCLGSLGT
jgi:hypothetical protein